MEGCTRKSDGKERKIERKEGRRKKGRKKERNKRKKGRKKERNIHICSNHSIVTTHTVH